MQSERNSLKPATNSLMPVTTSLASMFEDFFSKQNVQDFYTTEPDIYLLKKIIEYFDDKLGLPVMLDDKSVNLCWADIKEFLANHHSITYALNSVDLHNNVILTLEKNWYCLNFGNKQKAETWLKLVQLSLPNDLYQATKKNQIRKITLNSNIWFRFLLTSEQLQVVAVSHDWQLPELPIASVTNIINPLEQAILEQYHDKAKSLLQSYPALKDFSINMGEKPIHLAIRENDLDMVKILVETFQVDINARIISNDSRNGMTPISLVCLLQKSNSDMLQYLLDHNADPAIPCKDGRTPLKIAIKSGNHDKKQLLEGYLAAQWSNLTASDLAAFQAYTMNLRKIPDDNLKFNWLSEINSKKNKPNKYAFKTSAQIHEERINQIITPTEADYIKARKIWSDVVSETFQDNAKWKKKVKDIVIKRLSRFSKTITENLYQQCINYLQENSILTLTFNANFLNKHLTDFQPLNMWEKNNRNSDGYTLNRRNTETEMFAFLTENLKKEFFGNIHAKPRYATLLLPDRNTPIQRTSWYGNSFIVLKEVAKLNSLFCPGDTLNYYVETNNNFNPCTIHNPEFLLWQCSDAMLKAIIERLENGTFPSYYCQREWHLKTGGYVEAMIPPLNLLDPNFVESIYIDPREYKISLDDLQIIQQKGININNDDCPPYFSFNQQFMQNVENDKHTLIDDSLRKFPSLAKISDRNGRQPIHVAARCGSLNVLGIFAKHKLDFTAVYSRKLISPLHEASVAGHLEALRFIVNTIHNITNKPFAQYIDETTARMNTPLHLASRNGKEAIVQYLLDQGANINAMNKNGETPLSLAIINQRAGVVDILLKMRADLTIKYHNQDPDKLTSSAKNYRNHLKEIKNKLIAAWQKHNVDALKRFIPYKILFDLTCNAKNHTFLYQAVALNNLQLVKFLVEECNVNLNTRIDHAGHEDHGATAVYLASSDKNIASEILVYLIVQGADASIPDYHGRTPLASAAWHDLPERVKIIAKTTPANPNQTTARHHFSALMLATKHSSTEAVLDILEIPGIDIFQQNSKGENALGMTAKNGNLDKVAAILSAYEDIYQQPGGKEKCAGEAANMSKAMKIAKQLGHIAIADKIARFYLQIYVDVAEQRPAMHYKTRIPFFNISFGFSSDEKLAASRALLNEDIDKNNTNQPNPEDFAGELNNGELGHIYHCMIFK